MLKDSIYTIEEVAEHLRVPADVIEGLIANQELQALKVGTYWRIRESALQVYLGGAKPNSQPNRSIQNNNSKLTRAEDFTHIWPDTKKEIFTSVHEGVIEYGGREYGVKLGFTTRHSAGKERRRSLVLVDRYPTVEFVASGTEKNGRMAAIIRDRRGKQLPVGATVPPEYANLTVGSYRDVVEGSGASTGLAVICEADDFDTMVKHALIRYSYREDRKKKDRT